MPKTAQAYIALITLSGAAVMLLAARAWSPVGLQQFVVYLTLVALASTLKLRLPGLEGTISPNFIFLMLAMTSCSFSQVVSMALAAALVQSLWAAKQPRLVQVAFSAATLMVSSAVAYELAHLMLAGTPVESSVPLVLLAGSLYFPLNSALVSIVIGLVSGQSLWQVMRRCHESVFRHFMGGLIFAALISSAYSTATPWRGAVILLPVVLLAYFYHRQRQTGAAALPRSQAAD